MKISKKLREEAALVCDLAASADWHYDDTGLDHSSTVGGRDYTKGPGYGTVGREAGLSDDAMNLALDAFTFVCSPKYGGERVPWTRSVDAEAAQLLREGWSPKKP